MAKKKNTQEIYQETKVKKYPLSYWLFQADLFWRKSRKKRKRTLMLMLTLRLLEQLKMGWCQPAAPQAAAQTLHDGVIKAEPLARDFINNVSSV